MLFWERFEPSSFNFKCNIICECALISNPIFSSTNKEYCKRRNSEQGENI